MTPKKILFVCKYNAFRSRVAEEYFNKTSSENKSISRGIIMGENSDWVQRNIAKSLLGINIAKRKPLPLTFQSMRDADLIVVAANDITKEADYLENKRRAGAKQKEYNSHCSKNKKES